MEGGLRKEWKEGGECSRGRKEREAEEHFLCFFHLFIYIILGLDAIPRGTSGH